MIRIGRVVGLFGVRGAVKIEPETGFPERFDPHRTLRIGDVTFRIGTCHWHRGQARVALVGVDTAESAQALIGSEVWAEIAERPAPEQNEFYAGDLVGMRVVNDGGEEVGVVEEVLAKPAQDILRVGEMLIPFVREFVVEVRASDREITVRLIPGMRPGDD